MPEITSCPDCEKKLRVPDDLLGKKVKCPGCGGMFTASAMNGNRRDEDEEPTRHPRQSSRSEGYSERRGNSPAVRDRDRDRDEDRSRRRRDEEEDDDHGDRRRPRRDDYDDDDYDRSRRGRDDIKGWRGVRAGLNLVFIAGWLQLTMYGVAFLGGGILLVFATATISAFLRGGGGGQNAPNPEAVGGAVGMIGGMCLFFMILGLISFAELVLRLIGYGLCIQSPPLQGSPARGLAIAALACGCAAVLVNLGGGFINGFGGGMGNTGRGMALTMMGMGNAFGWFSNVLTFAGFVCWMFCMRAICLDLRNKEVAGRVLTVFIAYVVYGFVAAMIFVVMLFAVGLGIASAVTGAHGTAGTATAIGGGVIALLIVGGGLFLGHLGMTVWYVLTVQQVRGVVERHLNRAGG